MHGRISHGQPEEARAGIFQVPQPRWTDPENPRVNLSAPARAQHQHQRRA